MNNALRKDSKKDCCFEISAPDKRVYQVNVLVNVLFISNSLYLELWWQWIDTSLYLFLVLCLFTERGRRLGRADWLCDKRWIFLNSLIIILFVRTTYLELKRLLFYTDMEGIIPLEEDQDTYDDCLPLNTEAIDDDIYEELPGLSYSYILKFNIKTNHCHMLSFKLITKWTTSVWNPSGLACRTQITLMDSCCIFSMPNWEEKTHSLF